MVSIRKILTATERYATPKLACIEVPNPRRVGEVLLVHVAQLVFASEDLVLYSTGVTYARKLENGFAPIGTEARDEIYYLRSDVETPLDAAINTAQTILGAHYRVALES